MTPLPVIGQVTSSAGALRKDPYRLFFPLGVLLGWAGVGQWLWFSLGGGGPFRVVFHSMVQVQGFLGVGRPAVEAADPARAQPLGGVRRRVVSAAGLHPADAVA